MQQNKTFIKEIFASIQGEGPYVGFSQLFIRFSSCNLNCCYCDTDYKSNLKEYTSNLLLEEVKKYNNIHSISLTGGEPLLESDFLSDFLPLVKDKKIYLETNGTLYENLKKVINNVDIISMDIKLNSCSKCGNLFGIHDKFLDVAILNKKEIFIKLVFDENITEEEISETINLARKYNVLIVLQPKMDKQLLNIPTSVINKVFNEFISRYNNVRLIPQVHKFINVE